MPVKYIQNSRCIYGNTNVNTPLKCINDKSKYMIPKNQQIICFSVVTDAFTNVFNINSARIDKARIGDKVSKYRSIRKAKIEGSVINSFLCELTTSL